MKPNQKLIDMWTRASHLYASELPGSPAEEYLERRGLSAYADQFRLGFCAEPAPGHEDRFVGMLSIPYLTDAGVVGFKFRRIDAGEPRYLAPTGQRNHLYNVQAILDAVDQVLVVEGELDAVAATGAGFPAVALPGVKSFKPHMARCFDGIGRVIVITDNDMKDDGSNPGQELARKLVDVLPNAVRVLLPAGEDINSTIFNYGAQHLADLVGSID